MNDLLMASLGCGLTDGPAQCLANSSR